MYHALAEISRVGGGCHSGLLEGEPYNVDIMSESRLVPWLGFGVDAARRVTSVAQRSQSRMPADKAPPAADAELAAGPEVDPFRLLVDFKDDVSAETLANNGFTECPISDSSAKDPLYPPSVRERRRRGGGAGEAGARPERRGRGLRIVRPQRVPPDEVTAAAGSIEAECRGDDRRRLPERSAVQEPVAHAPDRHARGVEARRRQRRDRRGARHRRRLRGLRQVHSWPISRAQVRRPYDFVANNTHANDDHGHGSHVTGTIAQSTNNGIGVAGVALQRQDHAAQGAVGARLGLGRRHRRRDPLRRRQRREGHQHDARRCRSRRGAEEGRRVRARQGRHRRVRRRQREPRQGRLSGRVSGRDRGRGDAERRGDHVLLELRQGHRHRGAGRQHARRPERRRHARRRPAEHDRDRRPDARTTTCVHGHVDGVAARRGRRRARRRRRRHRIPTRSRRSCRDGAQAQAAEADPGRDDRYGAGIIDAPAAARRRARAGRLAARLGLC